MENHQTHTDQNISQPITVEDVPLGRIAMWWVIASEIIIFGGLIASYLMYRIRFPEWGSHSEHTSTPLGLLNTLVLLTSSYTAVLAHAEAVKGNIKKAQNYIWITIGFGCMFLCVKAIEYTTEFSKGFTPTSHLFWSFYYTMTGLHAFHIIVGMTALAFVARGISQGRNLHRVEMAGLYWHFVDIVWIFLFPLLYIAK